MDKQVRIKVDMIQGRRDMMHPCADMGFGFCDFKHAGFGRQWKKHSCSLQASSLEVKVSRELVSG